MVLQSSATVAFSRVARLQLRLWISPAAVGETHEFGRISVSERRIAQVAIVHCTKRFFYFLAWQS
jgi:hypothetical protein